MAITPEQIRASLSKAPATTQTGVPMNAAPKQQKKILLSKIYRYENNPRKTTNELLQAIKDSIRAVGLSQMFDVTQRPDDREAGLYVQSNGGGTRLEALKALYAEDQAAGIQNSPYEYVFCMYHPYVDELAIEAAHLIENMQRTQMSYWDSAVGLMRFKASIEAQQGRSLSLRELEEETSKLGMGVSRATLSTYQFGFDNFNALGINASALSGVSIVDLLRPAYLAAQRLATRGDAAGQSTPLSNEDFKAGIADPVMRAYAAELGETNGFDAKVLAKRLEQAVADAMGFDAKDFASLNALAVSNSQASMAELLGKDTKTKSIFEDDSEEDADGAGSEAGHGSGMPGESVPPALTPPLTPPTPPLPPGAYDRANASGEFTTVTDAEMAALEQQNAALIAQLNQRQEPSNPLAPSQTALTQAASQDPLAAMTTSIIAAVIASQTAMQASQSMALAAGQSGLPANTVSSPAPLISFTGSESPAQILDIVGRSARERVRYIASVYGIEGCLVDAPLLPLGYAMDLPASPFTAVPVAEAWWLLSYLSSLNLQDAQDVLHFVERLPKDSADQPLALAEFLGYFISGEEAEAQSLIGFNVRSADLGTFFWALCFPLSPCSDVMMELMQLIRILNQFQPNLMRHPLLPMNTPLTQVQGLLLSGYDQGTVDGANNDVGL